MYPLPTLRGTFEGRGFGRSLGRLGAVADPLQAQLLIDLGVRVQTPIAAAIQQIQNVAKYEPQLYTQLAAELTKLLDSADKLEQEINQVPLPMTEDTARVLYKKLETIETPAESLRQRVLEASRTGVEQKQLRTAVVSVTIGVLTVGLGWWVVTRVRKGGRRRRRIR